MTKGEVKNEEGVKVFLRIRPFSKKELTEHAARAGEDGDLLPTVVTCPVDECKLEFLDPNADFAVKDCMTFDQLFWSVPPSQCPDREDLSFADQEYVYDRTGKLCLEHAMEGYNSCLLAYGQTGSGKTHSMLGSREDEGIIPRLCKELFSTIEARKAEPKNKGTTYKVNVSFLEIYNEKVKDLLSGHHEPDEASASDDDSSRRSPSHNQYKDLRIRLHPTRGPFVEGLTEEEVSDWENCDERISYGFAHRTTKATAMNAVSSRSHAIFKLEVTQSMKIKATGGRTKQVHTVSALNLVDLAGSERASRTGATGDTLAEGIAINRSLTVLRKVIEALMENGKALRESQEKGTKYKPHPPPYRESTLTWLLSESFGGNSRTMMIAAASPHESNAEETLQTLKYALKTREIVNTVTRNEDKGMRMLREKNEEIDKLKQQLESAANMAQLSGHSAADEARLVAIESQLKEEEKVKQELMEEQEKLEKMVEEKEVEMEQARVEVEKHRAKAEEEATQRVKTQRAADIMGKWTRGIALGVDSSKAKKIKEREQQLEVSKAELTKEKEEKKRLEERNRTTAEEAASLKATIKAEKEAAAKLLAEMELRLKQEHDVALKKYKDTLEKDNDRLHRELVDLKSDQHAIVSELQKENKRLLHDIERTAGDHEVAREGLEGASRVLEDTKTANHELRQEAYELRAANVMLREENSTMRLANLKISEGGVDKNSAVYLQQKRETRGLEKRVAEMLDERAVRFKEIALLKADKKALMMENEEYKLETQKAKTYAFAKESQYKAKDAELEAYKKKVQREHEERKNGQPSQQEQQIMDLKAQLEVLRRSKEQADANIKEGLLEVATLKHNIRHLKEEHGLQCVDESGFDERFPAALVSMRPDPQDPVPGGNPLDSILHSVKVMDSKVSQCKKTLLELRLQGPESQSPEAALERADGLQQHMSGLLSDMSRTILASYECLKELGDSPTTPGRFDKAFRSFEPASAELWAKVEALETDKESLEKQLMNVELELSELRQESVSQTVVDDYETALQEALQQLQEAQDAPPEVIERVVQVQSELPTDVAELQTQLEEALQEADFQEEMKAMVEQQLEDCQVFQERYQTLEEAVADVVVVEGDDVEGYVEALASTKERLADLEAQSEELKEAKRVGIGATREDLDFFQTKARVLEQTLQDVLEANQCLERQVADAQIGALPALPVSQAPAESREKEILQMVKRYESEVREGFAQCKDRHNVVWRELQRKHRALRELKRRSHVSTLTPSDFAAYETDEPHAGSREAPAPFDVASPEVGVTVTAEETLLSRHEQLSQARQELAETLQVYSRGGDLPSPLSPLTPMSPASPVLEVTEHSPVEPPRALQPAGTTPVRGFNVLGVRQRNM